MNTQYDDCEDCGGDGYTTCCGMGVAEPGFPDNDICAGCGEHGAEICETCNGEGEVRIS